MPWTANSLRWIGAVGFCALLAGSCGGDEEDGAPTSDHDVEDSGDDRLDAGRGSSRRDAGASIPEDDGKPLPPEVEQQLSFETPKAGKTSVYVPDPDTNRVAVVNAGTFKVENVLVGSQPRFAATVPGQDVAIVLNVGSQDAALLRTSEQGVTTVRRLPLGHDANEIAVSPGGRHALVYFNASASSGGLAESYQDLSIIDLTAGAEAARRVSVGFKPRAVQFSDDGSRAFVITEDGISILELATVEQALSIPRLVELGDELSDAQSIDVQVTPDGAYALTRRDAESVLRLIDLNTGGIERLALNTTNTALDAGVPMLDLDGGAGQVAPELTDLDLSPDGSFALAVLRDRGAIVRVPIPQGFRDASALSVLSTGEALVGSVTISRSGTRAVGYTTAAPVESVTVFDLVGVAQPRGIRLRKTVRAVAVSDDGSRLLVLHGTSGDGSGDDDDASEGYSLVDTGSGFAKLQLTRARIAVSGLLLTPDGKRVFSLLSGKQVKSVEMADLDTFQVTGLELSTAPTSLGFVPGTTSPKVFVGQSGAGGITFLDASSGKVVRTVSGFEIASRIRQ